LELGRLDLKMRLRAGGGVNGIRARETLESPEPVERLDDFLGSAKTGMG